MVNGTVAKALLSMMRRCNRSLPSMATANIASINEAQVRYG